MPFLARWPGHVKAGSVSQQIVGYTDLLATFAAILGVQLPSGAGEDSFDILPVLFGRQPEEKPIRGPVVIPSAGGLMTIRSGPWKLIDGLGSGGFSRPRKIKPTPGGPEGQLYNLDDDPGEAKNLWLKHPDVVKRLRDGLARIRKSGTRPGSTEK